MTDHARNIRIAVTDYDWEYPKEDDEYNNNYSKKSNNISNEEEKDPLIDEKEFQKDK